MAMPPLRGRSLLCLQQGQHSLMTLWNPDLNWYFFNCEPVFRSEPPLSPKKAPSLPETSDVSLL